MSSDSTLIRRSAPSVVTKVRSALGSTITTQMPVSRPSTGCADAAMPSAAERVADEVAVRSGAVRAGVHAVRAEARGRDEHGDRAAGVVGRGGGHHVLPAVRQVGDLDDHVDQGLAGVDHPAHGAPRSTSSVVASVICGG